MATVCYNHVADQKERSVCKVTCYVAASFPVVLGDFGFDVTCLAFWIVRTRFQASSVPSNSLGTRLTEK